MSSTQAAVIPTLPQQDSADLQAQRAFQLSLARTDYNYMRSYLESVPMSADLPSAEKFSLDYEAQVLKVFVPLAENFKQAVTLLLERELSEDMPTDALRAVEQAYDKLSKEFSLLHPGRDAKDLQDLLAALAALPKAIEGMTRLPRDLEKMITGLDAVFKDLIANGPTAFLKSTLYDMLSSDHGRNYLRPRSLEDYENQFISLPKPLMLSIEQQSWMPKEGLPCQQDWFFGHLQIAGFNTTQLRGVVLERGKQRDAAVLSELQAKCPISDAILQSVTGDSAITLAQAIREHRLYVVDYAQLEGAKTNSLHDEQRYIAAPIALFYWNPTPPPGFPPGGALQPIAIQLGQRFDAEATPIYTPNDCAGGDDAKGYKWQIAKYIVNAVCAIQHESVAHLGDCHLIIEPMVVAMHRQLATSHPLYKLLIPHFRFTININDDAIHSLVVPGGVVACNVGIEIESTLALVSRAHRAWRWDERLPERQFALRAVDQLAVFPFRDDTLLLWKAIKQYVNDYLRLYYRNDQDVALDSELQGWIYELTAPQYCGFQGLDGLQPSGDSERPWKIDSLDYLIEMISLILYTAGPLHASVNYAQYPLMSFVPGVSGSVYKAPPTRSTQIESEQDLLTWYTPLDVALYGASFEFLLSSVQYDTFGHYEHNPRDPYFKDPRVEPIVAKLQAELAAIETEIRKRNQSRPMPYPFQLPSHIPNSISI
ncbi:lipoxygenase family protein [Pseudomarimonas arenosa]|uniref:Arachidonate 15-lipoxygenase n=1 Tax=Pseudomarimonas arenosa TaxID=2774145 RepID=A0AAW3ZN44_9GAMM|nr:lipoxygenase family protein [Pseudomarimonas arenosa]MBD8526617.1 arachidonate 15-lipoxygenase [Pseudomarimonas arenosa]